VKTKWEHSESKKCHSNGGASHNAVLAVLLTVHGCCYAHIALVTKWHENSCYLYTSHILPASKGTWVIKPGYQSEQTRCYLVTEQWCCSGLIEAESFGMECIVLYLTSKSPKMQCDHWSPTVDQEIFVINSFSFVQETMKIKKHEKFSTSNNKNVE